MIQRALLAVLFLLGATQARSVDTSWVSVGDSSQAFLAKPSEPGSTRRAAVLLAPEWWGVNTYPKRRAVELAEKGYVVLVVDLYGKRCTTQDRAQAQAWAGQFYAQPERFRSAMGQAFRNLVRRDDVDSSRVAAMGFCFGGTAVLEAARAGLPLRAVASFHGGVKPFAATPKGAVRAKVMVFHGGADRAVTMEDVAEFVKDMESSGADYGLEVFPGALHAFTNPEAGSDRSKGVAYDPRAEKASFESLYRLFEATGMKP